MQFGEPLSVSAYIALLDWLDKVRIGVWLTRHMIEKHPIVITPNFQISSRIAQKDRMVAVYAFDSKNMGINLFGSDSLIFSDMPSCFGFRINNILLLNVSADFFCAKGCGLPHPKSMRLLMDGENSGKLKLESFGYAANISNPIMDLQLFKPVVWIYQPIKLPSSEPIFRGGYYGYVDSFDSRISTRTMSNDERQGALFRQFADHVEVLRDPSALIEFDSVTGDDTAMQKDIAASVYDVQIKVFCAVQREWIEPSKGNDFAEEYRKLKLDHTAELAEMYRAIGV